MIETFKILSGSYNIDASNFFRLNQNVNVTRGHSKKLLKPRTNSTIRSHSFAYRVINTWNDLPEDAVSATSLNAFKNKLDRLWKHHPLRYDWTWTPAIQSQSLAQF
eukprot:GHVO01007245.1.p1 GENE.GHVO01007245.1~~GHVO01007245.1.p1  ORF type:complete len:106 (+),score=3.31 GHVO01007245.1:3-320(+)